ncbi:MAG: type 2 isopentenyl-diphosphate Delta-isomerase, partial [Pseudomonadota bacterium]
MSKAEKHMDSAERQRIARRKADHLSLAASEQSSFRKTSTLFENVLLVHQALPERSLDEIGLETVVAGHRLAAPLVIAGMTGGTPEAQTLNRDLAIVAEELGIGFGLGSQRPMVLEPGLLSTYQVRDVAPKVFLLGNIGAVQARELGVAGVRELVAKVAANAVCVHVNPAMELVQQGGDHDFRGLVAAIGSLASNLDVPVIVKETGCGLSPESARCLRDAGVRAVDVGGAGGTSWVGIETLRAADGSSARSLGEQLWDWGVPTAVSV